MTRWPRPRVWIRLITAVAAAFVMAGGIGVALTEGDYLFLGRPVRALYWNEELAVTHPCCMSVYTSWIMTLTEYSEFDIGDLDREGVIFRPIPAWIMRVIDREQKDTVRADIGWPLRFARIEHSYENRVFDYSPSTMHGVLWIGPVPLAKRPLFPGFLLLVAAVFVVLFAAEWTVKLPGCALRRWRARRGCCERCGYDLGGIGDAVCPECGTGTRVGQTGLE